MKKVFAFIFTIAFLAGFSGELSATDNKMIGIWKFEAPTAPYGYQKGTITIQEKSSKLVGEIKFADGYKMELKDVTVKGDSLTFGVYIDYTYISVKAQVNAKNTLTGTAQTPEGTVQITAKKE